MQRIKSLRVANTGFLPSASFLLSPEEGKRKQDRRFVSANLQRNGILMDYKGKSFEFCRSTSPLFFTSIGSCFSSQAAPESSNNDILDGSEQKEQKQQTLSPSSATVITDNESGAKYGIILDSRKLPKLKPGLVRKRLDNCRTYVGREKSIRQSPWKLNRICQLAAGLTLEEALTQLKFCELKNADLVAKVLKRTSNLADIRDGLQMSQLEVKECFATKSLMLRRIKTMGRGR